MILYIYIYIYLYIYIYSMVVHSDGLYIGCCLATCILSMIGYLCTIFTLWHACAYMCIFIIITIHDILLLLTKNENKIIYIYMPLTMHHIICEILLKSVYVMLFVITYATYCCYFTFSSPSWANVYTFTKIIYAILVLFCIVLHHFIFRHFWTMFGSSNHFYCDIYCPE